MSDADYPYMAGIIDGEGTITLTRNNKADVFRRPVVSVPNTDRGLVEWMHGKFGGKFIVRSIRNSEHKRCFVWRVECERALHVLEAVAPYLRVRTKRERAAYILQHYKSVTPRNGRYTVDAFRAKVSFEEALFSL